MNICLKQQKLKRSALLILSFALTLSCFAQQNIKQKVTNKKGNPTYISFTEKSTYKNNDSRQVFKEQLGLKDNATFSKIKSETDRLGFSHEKFQLVHEGIKVEFATYTLHSKSGKLESMNGEFYQLENINTSPKLTSNQAFEAATHHVNAKQYLWEIPQEALFINYKKPQGELVFLPILENSGNSKNNENIRLAYKFDIYATSPLSRGDIYIDAITGSVLLDNPTIKHLGEFSHGKSKTNFEKKENPNTTYRAAIVAGNAATRYSGTQTIQTSFNTGLYILKDATRGNGISTFNLKTGVSYQSAVDFTDVDNNWTAAEFNNVLKDNAALDAHWGAEKTYDYWSNVHGRNSYDNVGAALNSYVHYSSAYNNAFWNGSVMTYGDGSGTIFDALTSIDVVAHEIGHAICEKTANLVYQKESGAMNEAFSDIWGACVEYYVAPTKSTWLVGEDIEKRSGRLSMRSMSNPKLEGQPDTYGGIYWKPADCVPDQFNDYCGVHSNSGVLNHWFYILSIGKSGTNDKGSAYNVTGITINKAAKIAYRLESVYLTSNATYADARTFGIKSATDLYGAGSPEEIATTNAFYAVGLGLPYGVADTVPPTIPTNFIASLTSTTTVNLSWTASTDFNGATEYDVYKNGVLITTTATTSYIAAGLTPSTTYSFYVEAKDAAGNKSLASTAVNVTTLAAPDTTPPSAPTNLTVSGTTDTTTNLSWTASTDNIAVTGYKIYNGTVLLASVTGTTYSATGLTPNTAYTFTVKAQDAATNRSVASTAVNVTTLPDTTAPSAPTNLVASGTTATTTNLSWTGSTDNVAVTGYEIYKAGVLIKTATGKNYSATGLTPNTAYTFTVKAKDAATNRSLASTAVNVTTLPDTTAPSAPTNLVASGTTATTTNLSWTASTDNVAVTGYEIYKAGVLITTVTRTTYSATGLTPNTAYTFTVKAKDAATNKSLASTAVNVTTLAAPDTIPPSAPTNLAVSGTTATATNLSWTASTDNIAVTGYEIYNGTVLLASITGTTYSATGLTPNTAYTFTVKAKDAAANKSAASTVNVTTLPDTAAPSAPTNLVASGTTATTTNLSWTASTDNIAVTGYEIYKAGVLVTTVNGMTFAVTGLNPNTVYAFSVKAKDIAGNSSLASTIANISTANTAITIYVKKGVLVAGQEPKIHVWTKETGTDVAITNNTNWPTNLPTMNLTGTNNWYKFTLPNDSKALGCLFIFGTSQTPNFTGINADTWIEFNTDGSLKSNSNTAPILAPATMFTLSVAETDSTINKDETLIIYPNPATNLLNINYTAAGSRQIEVTIFDVRGNLVYTKKEQTKNGFNQELSLLGLNLKSGAYFLTIASSKSKMTKTFVVTE